MKTVKFTGIVCLMLGLLFLSTQTASAASLTPSEKDIVGALNPNLANSSNWTRTISGGTTLLELEQNNIKYEVAITGQFANWLTFNNNNNSFYHWEYNNGQWRLIDSRVPGPFHEYCPY